MSPKLGYLCLCENPSAEAGRALIRQFVLVREADRMGYDNIWIAENHFDGHAPSGAISTLLGYLAGVTSHARIGPLALLTPFRDPVQMAEDIATLDLLSKGRANLGVSRGGPFASHNQHFKVDAAVAPARAIEALELMHRLLGESDVSHAGTHFKTEHLTLAPQPAQARIPTWMATTTESTIAYAARHGHGLIASACATPERLRQMLGTYKQAAPDADPRLVLTRFVCPAPTRAEAEALALPYLENFAKRMAAAGVKDQPQWSAALNPEALLQQSLIGSYAEVAERITQLGAEYGVESLALIPTSSQFDTVKHCLADVVDEVRPLLPDY